ncbi:hypothetical protein [Anaeromyxobacter oryzae]|uniref:Uncharacterized protein n=1 Tax=Anaeromyxobacter oryzae TaxID=2918170 RepID=A0ABM7WWC1_9BACT|nr:hypothetical protein [Anaeromyxobacter oryzae]BDG03750.1 hypothetical protein AMOR_27460 [Anaeromyxobacter oryzae]
MAKLEALEGVGVFVLAIALLAAFTLRMSVPPADVLRAQTAPRVVTVHPTIVIPVR